jgi:hypothetical protein
MKRIAIGCLIIGALLGGTGHVAHAQAPFEPNPKAFESCGLGREFAAEARALQAGPGASEFARTDPNEFGCTGQS